MATTRKEREYGSARKRAETHESFQRTAIKLPDGMSFFNPKKPGVYRLNIIPYIVGEGHPTEKPGSIWYERTYWAYSQIGPNRQTFVAPGKTWKKRDPIAEYRNELQSQPSYDKDLVRKLFERERQLFLVQDISEMEKGVQLWDVSFHNFGKFLDQKVKNCDPEDADRYDLFFHPRKGLLLRVTAREKSIGDGKPYLEFNDIEFKDRSEQLSSSIVDEMPCLDDLLIETSYKDLKQIFFQSAAAAEEEPEGDDDDPIPAKSRRMDDDDDDEPAPKKKSRPVEDEDDEEPAPKKKKPPVDDDEDEEPAPKKKKPPVDDDDEDEPPKKKRPPADEEDEEPTPKKKKPPVDEDDDEPAPKKKAAPKDEEDSDCPVEKGQWLKFTYKGAKLVGKVVSINEAKQLIGVKASDRPEPHNLGWDDEFSITKAPKVDDEDEDEPAPKAKSKPKPPVDEDDEEPAPKKKKPPVDDDEDEDEVPSKRSGKKAVDDDDDDAPPRKSSKK